MPKPTMKDLVEIVALHAVIISGNYMFDDVVNHANQVAENWAKKHKEISNLPATICSDHD